MSTTKLRVATRKKAKIRLGVSAVSGGGKTYSALLISSGMAPMDKIALIDTENGSGDLYSHLGEYNVLPLQAPFTPESYIEAIKECEAAGMEVIIIDSITHEWDGKGGCLEIQTQLGGKYQDWAKVTPRHQSFIDAILESKCHIITTVRRKQDYEMTKDGNGKVKVEKAGLKEVTREGFEYELTANLEIDIRHNASASKDRTGLFMGKPEFIPSKKTGEMLLDWCESGVDAVAVNNALIENEKKAFEKHCKDQNQLLADNYRKDIKKQIASFHKTALKAKDKSGIEEAKKMLSEIKGGHPAKFEAKYLSNEQMKEIYLSIPPAKYSDYLTELFEEMDVLFSTFESDIKK